MPQTFYYKKKAAVVLNFCLYEKFYQSFLLPRMIESVPKTFMPIQTLVLHSELIELQIGCSQRCQTAFFSTEGRFNFFYDLYSLKKHLVLTHLIHLYFFIINLKDE